MQYGYFDLANMSSPDRTLRPLGQTISAHRNTVRLSPTMPAVTAL